MRVKTDLLRGLHKDSIITSTSKLSTCWYEQLDYTQSWFHFNHMNHQNVLWLVYTKSWKRNTQQQPHGYDTVADINCFPGAGILISCVQNISLVAVIFIAALCFAFIERMVAFFGQVSFAQLFTGTLIYDRFGKSIHFHWSIVESHVILHACVSVIDLIKFLIFFTFLIARASAVITAHHIENTCGDRMIYLVTFSKVRGGGGKLKISLVALLWRITPVVSNRGYIFHAISF